MSLRNVKKEMSYIQLTRRVTSEPWRGENIGNKRFMSMLIALSRSFQQLINDQTQHKGPMSQTQPCNSILWAGLHGASP